MFLANNSEQENIQRHNHLKDKHTRHRNFPNIQVEECGNEASHRKPIREVESDEEMDLEGIVLRNYGRIIGCFIVMI